MPERKQYAGLWFSLCAVVIWFAAGTLAHAQSENIQALWHLDNSYADSSGHSHTLLPYNSGFENAKFEQGLTLDGSSSLAYAPDPDGANNLDGFSALTIEAWVKPTTCSTGLHYLVAKKDEAGKLSYYLALYDCKPTTTVVGSGFEFANSSITLEAGKWTHLAATWDGSTRAMKIYINGTLDTTAEAEESTSDMNDTASPVVLGGDYDSSVPQYIPSFNGTLDEVRIWSRALTPAEVMSSAQAGLRADWHFDENSGKSTADSSGYSNTGTIHDAAWRAASLSPSFFSNLTFDGTDDYVEAENSISLSILKDLTIDAWIDPTTCRGGGSGTANGIVSKGDVSDAGGAESYALFTTTNLDTSLTTGCRIGLLVNVEGTGRLVLYSSDNAVRKGKWTHVAGTYDGNSIRLYANGTPVGDNSFGTNSQPLHQTDYPVLIGESYRTGGGGTSYFQGKIDEVHIWARALNPDEIGLLAGTYGKSNPAPLFIPDIWKEKFGTGAVYGSDWHVGNFSPATVLQMVVPDDPGTTIEDIAQTKPPKSGATLDDSVLGNSDLDALINGQKDGSHKVLHVSTTLSDGTVLKSIWVPGN